MIVVTIRKDHQCRCCFKTLKRSQKVVKYLSLDGWVKYRCPECGLRYVNQVREEVLKLIPKLKAVLIDEVV